MINFAREVKYVKLRNTRSILDDTTMHFRERQLIQYPVKKMEQVLYEEKYET